MKHAASSCALLPGALLVFACQAPDRSFFDRPLSSPLPDPADPLSPAPSSSDGEMQGRVDEAEPVPGVSEPQTGGQRPSTIGSKPAPTGDSTSGSIDDAGEALPDTPEENPPDAEPEVPACITQACAACRAEERCESGLLCHPLAGLCVPACRADGDCDTPQSPICSRGNAGEMGICVECEADVDCRDDDLPACGTAGSCVECTRDEHCAEQGSDRVVCDAARALCVECVTDADCDDDDSTCVDSECRDED